MPLSSESQRFIDGLSEEHPALLFFVELPSAFRRDGIEARLPTGVGGSPVRPEPLIVSHALERGVERTLFDPERPVSRLVDSLGNRIAVLRSRARQRFENQQVEGALKAIVCVF